ncbi:MAG: LcoC [Bacillales bacterium]|jgi:FtsP/CotA-like multicopper oxidase with cupredoxin domain|nr:LcoC [Bacillales bacterium]
MKKIGISLLLVSLMILLSACSELQKSLSHIKVENDVSSSSDELKIEKRKIAKKVKQNKENPFNILSYEPDSNYKINIVNYMTKTKAGSSDMLFKYVTGLPGGMIIVNKDTDLTLDVQNYSHDNTSIYWHGLTIPNSLQNTVLLPGEKKVFNFKQFNAGTFWFHSQQKPVLEQLNKGLYAPFIIKEDYDSKYAGDYVLMLDDWALSKEGKVDNKYSTNDMEIIGNKETVNGKAGYDIYPISLKKGEIIKLRFINVSTAQTHTVKLEGHQFRVTHLDGIKVLEPYMVSEIKLSPGERVDVEIKGTQEFGTFYITNERNLGIKIPVVYSGIGKNMESPFISDGPKAFVGMETKNIDFEYVLNSKMKKNYEYDPKKAKNIKYFNWTINGKSYPEVNATKLKVGQVYKMRFINKDTQNVHEMSHSMHIQGTHFQIISINGVAQKTQIFKDTVEIKPNEYVDIAVKFENSGNWMLHSHIIDYEDRGMITIFEVE